ncbi:MAG TPA: hypothetical protein VF458_19260 [Ktedonobacteraceae bacterium]
MKTSIKFIYTSLLLCLALWLTCATATGTIQAYQQFQQEHQRVQSGDAATVRPWMTIPYVARVYRVPEPCFTETLRLDDHWLVEHATLRVIADHYKRPVDKLIHDVRDVIQGYRRKQLFCGSAPPATQTTKLHLFPTSTRKGNTQ